MQTVIYSIQYFYGEQISVKIILADLNPDYFFV